MNEGLPNWASDIIDTTVKYSVQDGVLRFLATEVDSGIDYYRLIDGAHMHERAEVSFAMSALDKVAYREHLLARRPPSFQALIVDVGGGDGRNALPWLEWGYKRVVVIDPVISGLSRLRSRIAERNPDWLSNLLLIEADARDIPLVSGCAAHVQAVEALYYLNESYEEGLQECIRVLSNSGALLVSERDYEGGLLTALLCGGVSDCLMQAGTRDVWDGVDGLRVRSRCFTTTELEEVFERNGLRVLSHSGTSALSLILSYLRANGKLSAEDESRIGEVRNLLCELASNGLMRRCHVVVAKKANPKDGDA